MNLAGSRMDTEVQTFPTALDLFIMFEWQIQRSDCGGCGTRTRFPVFGRNPRCAVFSAIRRRGSLLLSGAQKNTLRLLWSRALRLVRPPGATGTRSFLWRCAHLSGARGAAGGAAEIPRNGKRGE